MDTPDNNLITVSLDSQEIGALRMLLRLRYVESILWTLKRHRHEEIVSHMYLTAMFLHDADSYRIADYIMLNGLRQLTKDTTECQFQYTQEGWNSYQQLINEDWSQLPVGSQFWQPVVEGVLPIMPLLRKKFGLPPKQLIVSEPAATVPNIPPATGMN